MGAVPPTRCPHWILTAALVGLAAAVVAILCVRTARTGMAMPFRRDVWLVGRHHEVRYCMADDLMRHHLRLGMPREQVTALLGPPSDRPSWRAHRIDWYELGIVQGWIPLPTVDEMVLELRYDSADRLIGMSVSES
jgi:hypothetical protein